MHLHVDALVFLMGVAPILRKGISPMRDYLSVNDYTSGFYREQIYTSPRSGGQWVYSQGENPDSGTDQVPITLRGRSDSQVGPKPYPTPYYGFRFQNTYQPSSWVRYKERYQYWGRAHGWVNADLWNHDLELLSWYDLLHQNFTFFTEQDGKSGWKPKVSLETQGRAIKSANAKLRSESINIGQSVGELPELLREVSKFVGGVAKTILALKRGNIPRAQYHLGTILGRRRAAETTQGVANAYLFYRFGVAPVLNDINHMVDEIGKAMSAPDFLKVKGTATRKFEAPSVNWAFETSGELLEVCEVGYSVRPKAHYAAAFLGLTNPLSTLWELVPLSFVANWFVSIGDTLSALDAGVGLDFVSGYKTTVVKGIANHVVSDPAIVDNYDTTGYYRVKVFAMEREILSSPAIPGLYFKTRGLGAGKLTTLSALLFSSVNTDNLEPFKKR